MFETVKEVDEEKVAKENNILLTREPTDSLLLGSVEYSYGMNHSLAIEGYVKKNKFIVQWKDYSVLLLNEVEITLHDKQIE